MSTFLVPLLWVPGECKGQPRPRAMSFKGKARVFNPSSAEGFKAGIAVVVKPFIPAEPWEGPVSITIVCQFSRPKSHSTKKGIRPNAPVYHTSKPDADNVAKAIADALTTVGLWKDDAQISAMTISKRYGNPGCWLEVEALA